MPHTPAQLSPHPRPCLLTPFSVPGEATPRTLGDLEALERVHLQRLCAAHALCTCTVHALHMHCTHSALCEPRLGQPCNRMHPSCNPPVYPRYVAAGINPENLPFRNFERRELMSRFNLSLSLLEAGGGGSGLKAIRNAHKLSKLAQARYLVITPPYSPSSLRHVT